MSAVVRMAFVALAAASATMVSSFVLLGFASGPHDPVGQLTPLAYHPQPPRPPTAPKAATPSRTVPEGDRRQDD